MTTGIWLRRWLHTRIRRRIVHPVCRQFHRDPGGGPSRAIVVAGTARSGTTWLAEIVDAIVPCRLMFEPFNPEQVRTYRAFNYFQYMRPEREDEAFRSFVESVLNGQIRDPWIDRAVNRLRPERRLIKCVRGLLLLKWMALRFPTVPIFLIVRHPCAVVLSRMRLGWATDKDLSPLFTQQELVEDHLSDRLSLMSSVQTEEEKHAVLWSVSHLVPFRQFSPGEIEIVFYEDLIRNPTDVLGRICHRLGMTCEKALVQKMLRPSRTTTRSRLALSPADRLSEWQRVLRADQVDRIRSVVRAFGLDGLYGDHAHPVVSADSELLGRAAAAGLASPSGP